MWQSYARIRSKQDDDALPQEQDEVPLQQQTLKMWFGLCFALDGWHMQCCAAEK